MRDDAGVLRVHLENSTPRFSKTIGLELNAISAESDENVWAVENGSAHRGWTFLDPGAHRTAQQFESRLSRGHIADQRVGSGFLGQ